jgi:hypothetical protein
MLEKIFGKGSFSRTIGTRTNVVRFPRGQIVDDLDTTKSEYNIEKAAEKKSMAYQVVKKDIEDRMGDITKMNDSELLKYTANVRRILNVEFPPSAEVVEAGSKQQVTGKGLEELIDKEGLVASPKTPLGKIQFGNKRAEYEMNKIIKENDLDSLLKGIGRDQLSEIRLHNEGLVRAVTRQILSEDIKAGKIKSLTLEDLGTSREPIDYFRKIYGENALEQLDSLTADFNRLNTEQEAAKLARSKFKFEPNEARAAGSASYEDVEKAKETKDERSFLEKLFGINKDKGKKEAEVLNLTAEGDKRKSIDQLIDEYNANYDRTLLTDNEGGSAISYQEFQDIHKRNEEIAKALEEKGIKSTPDVEEVKPEGIVIPFRKKFPKPEPEEKSGGGIIGYATGGDVEETPIKDLVKNYPKKYVNLIDKGINKFNEIGDYADDYFRRKIEQTLTDEQRKKFNLFMYGTRDATVADIIKESADQDLLKPSSNFERRTKEAMGGRIGYEKGKRVISSIDKLLEDMNKKLSKKKSMETVDTKTGEVTVPKKPIKRAEEPTGVTVMDPEPEIVDERSITKTKSIMTIDDLKAKHKEAFKAHDQIFNVDINDKIAPDMIAESMAETKGKDYFSLSQKEQSDLYKKALAYVDDVRMTKKQNKPIEGGFDFNDPEIKAQMEKAMQEAPVIKNRALDSFLKVLNTDRLELERIQQKYTGVIDDSFLEAILLDPNPQTRAEIMAQIDEALVMQQKGMSGEEIIDVLDKTKRTKQADGGIAGLL